MKQKKPTTKKHADKIVFVQDLKGTSHPISLTTVDAVHPALKKYFCYCLYKATNQIKIAFESALTPFRFQTLHFGILCILETENNLTQHEVGDLMGIDKASMVKLIDHLESLKIVERLSGEDRRCKMLHLTPHGKSVLTKAKEAVFKAEKIFMKNLSDEEQDLIRLVLPKTLT